MRTLKDVEDRFIYVIRFPVAIEKIIKEIVENFYELSISAIR